MKVNGIETSQPVCLASLSSLSKIKDEGTFTDTILMLIRLINKLSTRMEHGIVRFQDVQGARTRL